MDNKSLITCFGVKYRCIFLLVACILTYPAGSSNWHRTNRKGIVAGTVVGPCFLACAGAGRGGKPI